MAVSPATPDFAAILLPTWCNYAVGLVIVVFKFILSLALRSRTKTHILENFFTVVRESLATSHCVHSFYFYSFFRRYLFALEQKAPVLPEPWWASLFRIHVYDTDSAWAFLLLFFLHVCSSPSRVFSGGLVSPACLRLALALCLRECLETTLILSLFITCLRKELYLQNLFIFLRKTYSSTSNHSVK